MAKRSAEDAGLNESQAEENNEEFEENDGLEDADDVEGEEDDNQEENSDSHSNTSSDTSDMNYVRSIAMSWVEDNRIDGLSPERIFALLGMPQVVFDEEKVPLSKQWELLESMVQTEPVATAIFRLVAAEVSSHRNKLPNINTFDDVANLIESCNNIVILTGAGVSVSCGIPDFRSEGGLYSVIEEKYNLPEPQCLFDIHYLRDDPKPFFEFAREIYPGKHKPSPTHYFIKELAQRGKLLRNYTQNIDTLEHVAGIDANKLVNCHGSFATASCIMCKRQVDSSVIKNDIMNKTIPLCTVCNDGDAFMKPDIVFFGESLPDRFDDCLKEDIHKIDLLLVMGSSLKVKPVAYVPEVIKAQVPQILVNRELVGQPHEFDYAHLGDCDAFVLQVCKRLNWSLNGLSPDSYSLPLSSSSISSASISVSSTTSSSAGLNSTTSSFSSSLSVSITSLSSSVTSPLPSPSILPSFDISNLDSLPPAPGPINL